MSRTTCSSFLFALLAAFAAAAEVPPASSASAAETLRCGLEKRYNQTVSQIIDVSVTRGDREVRRFRLQMASKLIKGSYRSLVYFLAPPDEKGMRVLTLERAEKQDEHFVFLPAMGRTKRVYGGRRQEPFLGTEFSYQDMERLRADDLEVVSQRTQDHEGEAVTVISTTPRFVSGYSRTEFLIAQSDCNIVEIRHYKKGRDSPSKVIEIPRRLMVERGGVWMPSWAIAKNLESDRATELRFSQIDVNPEFNDREFSVSALQTLKGIPGLSKSTRSVEPPAASLNPGE